MTPFLPQRHRVPNHQHQRRPDANDCYETDPAVTEASVVVGQTVYFSVLRDEGAEALAGFGLNVAREE